jgi:hypothetical protein
VGFLRRVLGGGTKAETPDEAPVPTAEPAETDADERARERELARFDAERVDDLVRRQQRYADRSWKPPAQGGERRADDADRPEG